MRSVDFIWKLTKKKRVYENYTYLENSTKIRVKKLCQKIVGFVEEKIIFVFWKI